MIGQKPAEDERPQSPELEPDPCADIVVAAGDRRLAAILRVLQSDITDRYPDTTEENSS
jgi:hypothetical protein